jgi:hypothetical protein
MPREDGTSTSAQLLTSQAKNVTIALAVLSIYAVDFAINVGMYLIFLLGLLALSLTVAVQACCRSLVVDTLPIPLQQAGSAWGMSLHASSLHTVDNAKIMKLAGWRLLGISWAMR